MGARLRSFATVALVAANALVVCLTLWAPSASAATYSNTGQHYSFAYPDGWTEEQNPNVDAAILGPSSGGFRPNMVAQHEAEPGAQDNAAWLLAYVKNSLAELKARMNITVVEEPQTFTTGSGRLAGGFAFDRVASGIPLRQRQVFFVSQAHQVAYFVTLTDKTSTFDGHGADWARAVDSFAVAGEYGLMSPLSLGLVAAAASVGASGALIVRRRRRARAGPKAPASAQH